MLLIIFFTFVIFGVVTASNYNIAGGLAEIDGKFIKFNGNVPILSCKKALDIEAFCTTNYEVMSKSNYIALCKKETCFVNISCTILNSEIRIYLPTFWLTNEVCTPVQNVTDDPSAVIFGCNIDQLSDGLSDNINYVLIKSLTKYSFSIVNGYNSVNVCKIENCLNMSRYTTDNSCGVSCTFSDPSNVVCQSLTDITYQKSQDGFLQYFQKKKLTSVAFYGGISIFFIWMVIAVFI
jgi:hypothetical protein